MPTAGDLLSALGSSDWRAVVSRSGSDNREADNGGCADADAALAAPEVVGDGAADCATAGSAIGEALPAAPWASDGASIGDP